MEQKLNTIEEAIEDIKNGKIVIIVDDEDRENEGDFVCAAECVTPEIINFMATNGRGLICTPILKDRAEHLNLPAMVDKNTDLHGTAFTVSIDYKLKGCTTGISAYDRATGIKALLDPNSKPEDYARPGHIFPLVGKEGGVLRRTGHTEASIDLARMAGFYPAGVLVEILNEDGSMARLPQLMLIAKKFDLKLISIKDLVAYRMKEERLISKVNSTTIQTESGQFDFISYKEENSQQNHLVIKMGQWTKDEPVLTRVHSGSDLGEIFSILIKSRGKQLFKTMDKIAEEGKGIIILLRYNESSPDLPSTIEKLESQRQKGENKNIGIGSQILNELGVRKVKLITNNPRKIVGLNGYGIEIVENIPI
ncbi:UNVERIFIED_CONTAM: hypothetical protein GTU68_054288 [Idotea baltica]|nr:hypothetical protein [Idotea baltica]